MLIAAEVDFIELILVDEVFSNLFEVVISSAVVLGGVSEEESTLLEGEGTYFSYFISPLDQFDGLIEE